VKPNQLGSLEIKLGKSKISSPRYAAALGSPRYAAALVMRGRCKDRMLKPILAFVFVFFLPNGFFGIGLSIFLPSFAD